MRVVALITVVLLAGCSDMSPTAPSNARVMLAISQSQLLINGEATVTATVREASGALVDGVEVRFSSSLGTFAPKSGFTRAGIIRSTFTATSNGIGAISALSGNVASDVLTVRVGAPDVLPEIITTPPTPTIFVSCQNGVAGRDTICNISGSSLQNIVVNWGDGSAEQSYSPITSSVVHVFPRANSYVVTARGEGFGRTAAASTTAIVSPQPEPPPVALPPSVSTTFVTVTQEANIVGGCAVFAISATAASHTVITSLFVEKNGVKETDITPPGARIAICGLVAGNVVTAKATDLTGYIASYPLIVK